MFHSKLSLLLLALIIVLALTAFSSFPATTVYHPYQTNPVMANADGSGGLLGVVDPAHDYRVVSYNWTPWTASNAWAYIEYQPGHYGYAPVQIGYSVVATVKYNVGVICCGSIPY